MRRSAQTLALRSSTVPTAHSRVSSHTANRLRQLTIGAASAMPFLRCPYLTLLLLPLPYSPALSSPCLYCRPCSLCGLAFASAAAVQRGAPGSRGRLCRAVRPGAAQLKPPAYRRYSNAFGYNGTTLRGKMDFPFKLPKSGVDISKPIVCGAPSTVSLQLRGAFGRRSSQTHGCCTPRGA
jgi:hypothetical protein